MICNLENEDTAGVGAWVRECCRENPFTGSRRSLLYASYLAHRQRAWEATQAAGGSLADHGGVLTQKRFHKALVARHGVRWVKTMGIVQARGLLLLATQG